MIWKKEFGTEQTKSFEYVSIAAVIFFLIGIFTKNPIPFIAVGVFVIYLVIYKRYDKGIGEKLDLVNPRTTMKLFPEEEATLTVELQNRSIFPLVNGEFQLQIGSAVRAFKHVESSNKSWNQIEFPLSILRKRKTIIEIPVVAHIRGTSKIRNITFKFPHLFNFDLMTLKHEHFYHTEIIVFPTIIPVQGTEEVFHMIPGNERTNFSPFEDIQSPLGTRDYSYSDPFHRINWKASVKTQTLQTNVYDKVVDMSYVFIVNLGPTNNRNMTPFNENKERLLSYTAYLSQFATKQGFPYELFINSRKPGKVPYVHLQEGKGKVHYGQALETLARIPRLSINIPFNHMLYQLGKQFYKPKTIIILGNIPPEASQIIGTWKQAQKTIFHIQQVGDGAVLKPWVKDAINHAE